MNKQTNDLFRKLRVIIHNDINNHHRELVALKLLEHIQIKFEEIEDE